MMNEYLAGVHVFLKSLPFWVNITIIIIWCSIESVDVNVWVTQSPIIEAYGHCRLQLPWLRMPWWFFLLSGDEKLLACSWGFEPTSFELSSQFGPNDLSAKATPMLRFSVILSKRCCPFSSVQNYYPVFHPLAPKIYFEIFDLSWKQQMKKSFISLKIHLDKWIQLSHFLLFQLKIIIDQW